MSKALLALTLILTVILTGCVPDKEDTAGRTCLETYSEESGYDFESDMWHQSCVASMDDTAIECEPPSVSDIEEQCAAEGHACDGLIAVTRDAAACIAEVEGMAEGLEGLKVDLIYNHTYNLPIWAVSNILTQSGDASSGKSLAISAVDGEVLGESQWMVQP